MHGLDEGIGTKRAGDVLPKVGEEGGSGNGGRRIDRTGLFWLEDETVAVVEGICKGLADGESIRTCKVMLPDDEEETKSDLEAVIASEAERSAVRDGDAETDADGVKSDAERLAEGEPSQGDTVAEGLALGDDDEGGHDPSLPTGVPTEQRHTPSDNVSPDRQVVH